MGVEELAVQVGAATEQLRVLEPTITRAETLERQGFGETELGRLAELLADIAASQGLPPEEGVAQFFETVARYHMIHALGLLAVGWMVSRGANAAATAGWAMQVGIVLFSGSLYALAMTGTKWLGAVTPLGGLAFMIGWAALAWAALHL